MGIRVLIRGLAASVIGVAMIALHPTVAGADPNTDVVGKTYGEAKGILGKAGKSTVVSTVLGDRAQQDQCFVMSTTQMTPLDSSGNATAQNQVQVNLNCYAAQSDKKTPGNSKGNNSEQAVATRATQDEATKKWKASSEGQAWCAKFEGEHPEWAPIPDCPHTEEEAAALKVIATKLWKATPEGQAWCAKTEGQHPEWAPLPDCHPDGTDPAAAAAQPVAS